MKKVILTAFTVLLSLFGESIQAQVPVWTIPLNHKAFVYVSQIMSGERSLWRVIEVVSPEGRTYFFVGKPGEMVEIQPPLDLHIVESLEKSSQFSSERSGIIHLERSYDHSTITLKATPGLPGKMSFAGGHPADAAELRSLRVPEPLTVATAHARILSEDVPLPRLVVGKSDIVHVYEGANGDKFYRVSYDIRWNRLYYQMRGSEFIIALKTVASGRETIEIGSHVGTVESMGVDFARAAEGVIESKQLGTTFTYRESIWEKDFNARRMKLGRPFGANHNSVWMSDVDVFDERVKSRWDIFTKMAEGQKQRVRRKKC